MDIVMMEEKEIICDNQCHLQLFETSVACNFDSHNLLYNRSKSQAV